MSSRGASLQDRTPLTWPLRCLSRRVFTIKSARKELSTFGDKSGKFTFHGDGARPWKLVPQYDVALPSATQNEVDESDAQAAIKAGCRYIAEGSNMGCTQEAIDVFEATRAQKGKGGCVFYGPGKAANAGGVAVSGLEMAQNSQRLKWSLQQVDGKLKDIMTEAFRLCLETGKKYGDGAEVPSLVQGANIAGFLKVADAMKAHGDWW